MACSCELFSEGFDFFGDPLHALPVSCVGSSAVVFFRDFAEWPFCRDRTVFVDENVGLWVHPGTPQRHPKSVENGGK